MSLIDPLSCGFAKVICYQMFTDRTPKNCGSNAKHQQRELLRPQFDSFQSQFISDIFNVSYSQFKDNFWQIIYPIQSLGGKISIETGITRNIFEWKVDQHQGI